MKKQKEAAGEELLEQEGAGAQQEAAGEQPGAEEPGSDGAEALKEQLAELNDKMMRTLAEYDNYRKRSQRERMEIYPDAVAATVTKFLPVLDNFERAMQSECTDAEFKKGVEMIFASFRECLESLNVVEIEAKGLPFDPNFHNAVMHIESDELGENIVADVFQKGYRLGDRVLRHAMVQVAN